MKLVRVLRDLFKNRAISMQKSPEAQLNQSSIVGVWNILPPKIITGSAATPVLAYDKNLTGRNVKMRLQNLANAVVKYAFNQDASDVNFHGSIAVAFGAGDPLVLEKEELSSISKISVFCQSTAINLAITEYQES